MSKIAGIKVNNAMVEKKYSDQLKKIKQLIDDEIFSLSKEADYIKNTFFAQSKYITFHIMDDGSIVLTCSDYDYDEAQIQSEKIKKATGYDVKVSKQMNNGIIIVPLSKENNLYNRLRKFR